jgi:LysR family transcriptional regulator, low CO2-responsive transcriptional regulator
MLLRNVTLKQLRVFAAVVRSGSMSGAAKLLNVSPPAVTLQIQLLQQQVGLSLLERSPNGTRPTQAGSELLGAVERIEAALAESGAVLASIAGSERGSVSVGITSTAKYFAPRALAAFSRAHPAIELCLTIGNRAEIIDGLRRLQLDIAVMGRPPEEIAVEAIVIGDHPHFIVAPCDHPLARRAAFSPKLLAGETFLVREPGSGTRNLMERFFVEAGVAPKIGMQIGSNETIKQAVIAGLGITFISGHTVDSEIVDGRLTPLKVKGLPIVRQWYVVHLSERRRMPAVEAVCKFLAQEGGRFLPETKF